jgi:hypothetical protein
MTDTKADTPNPETLLLHRWEKLLEQEGDCCDGDRQMMHIGQDDGGGGPFWFIETERWAFNSIDELIALLERAGVPRSPPEPKDGEKA